MNEAVGIDTSKYVKGVDYGDLDIWNAEKAYLGSIPQEMKAILETGTIPIVLGGDHSITFPELLAYKDVYGPVSIIHFDSHTDTWGSDTDKEHHDHSTPFRRAIEYDCIDPKTSIQVGMRGGLFEESDFDFANNAGLEHIYAVDIHHMGIEKTAELIREKVGNNKVMVTFDIDFVDPAFAPGTGTPVSCGFTSRQALELIRRALIGLDIVTEDGEKIGTVSDVFNTGSNDIYEVKREGKKNLLLPVIDDVVLNIDVDGGKNNRQNDGRLGGLGVKKSYEI